MDFFNKQGLCHTSAKYPWLILVCSLWGPSSVMINSYQAEGGACIKTFVVGYILQVAMIVGLYLWWLLLVPLLIAIICYALGILHGYSVF